MALFYKIQQYFFFIYVEVFPNSNVLIYTQFLNQLKVNKFAQKYEHCHNKIDVYTNVN